MAKDIKIVTVFVASPGDVVEERDAVQAIVDEFNNNVGTSVGLRLEVLRWERDGIPGFGVDPQDVINQSIGDEYDIFVGILANRFGTPTERAESGTAEEFDRAYRRFEKDNSSVRLMLYFNEAPINPTLLDLDQLKKVQDFRKTLGEKGGLYRTYDNLDLFKNLFRSHLTRIALGIKENAHPTKGDSLPVDRIGASESVDPNEASLSLTLAAQFAALEELAGQALSEVPGYEDELGILDFVLIYHSEFTKLEAAILELTELNERFPKELEKRTSDFHRIAKITQPKSALTELRRATDLSARLFDIYSETSERSVQKLSNARIAGFAALGNAVAEFADNPHADDELFSNLAGQLSRYELSTEAAYGSLAELKETVERVPSISQNLSKAQKRLSASMNEILKELEANRLTAADLRATIESLLGD